MVGDECSHLLSASCLPGVLQAFRVHDAHLPQKKSDGRSSRKTGTGDTWLETAGPLSADYVAGMMKALQASSRCLGDSSHPCGIEPLLSPFARGGGTGAWRGDAARSRSTGVQTQLCPHSSGQTDSRAPWRSRSLKNPKGSQITPEKSSHHFSHFLS